MHQNAIEAGARYDLFGERLIAVEWESDDGDWLLLHDVQTDEPRYRVFDTGGLERCLLVGRGELRGTTCDFTVDDLHLMVRPYRRQG